LIIFLRGFTAKHISGIMMFFVLVGAIFYVLHCMSEPVAPS